MYVDEVLIAPGDPVTEELRNLFGLGFGGLFESRDTNGFHCTGHVVLYPGAEGGTAKEMSSSSPADGSASRCG